MERMFQSPTEDVSVSNDFESTLLQDTKDRGSYGATLTVTNEAGTTASGTAIRTA